jgi:hypothetical protein
LSRSNPSRAGFSFFIGNPIMDQSVLDAFTRVTKIDSPPTGLGSSDGYTININFKLQ